MRAFAIVLVLAAACGGPQPDRPPPPEPGAAGAPPSEQQAYEDSEMNMPPALKSFHDVLAPRWHAAKTPARRTDTCAVTGELATSATAVAMSSPPPNADATAWASGGRALADAVGNLTDACKAGDADAFEAAFEQVHARFHELLESH